MPLPLGGRRILVTRTREQSSGLAAALRELGAEVLEVPTIRIVPPPSYEPLDRALGRLADYDVLLVTSANTARVLGERKPPPWDLQPFTVAVGPATAEALLGQGLQVDLQPVPAIAESLVRELTPTARGKRMLLARATNARELLPQALREAGATVDIVEAYSTSLDSDSAHLLEEVFAPGCSEIDAVTFTSSSTVSNFFALLGPEAARRALAGSSACSIGPVTTSTLRGYGVAPAAEAVQHDVAGLVAAVRTLLTARDKRA